MALKTLDHVALWVSERDAIAAILTRDLGMHVIERTETFTLVGADARRGKLTLFDAEGRREAGALLHVGLRVPSLDGREPDLVLPDGLRIRLVEAETDIVDLDHVALACKDPAACAEGWVALGFEPATPSPAGCDRVQVGGAFLELQHAAPAETERPLLNHLAVLVDSADEWKATAEDLGVEIADIKDAPNTYAVFVWGPERVKLEYVEHKPSFSLV